MKKKTSTYLSYLPGWSSHGSARASWIFIGFILLMALIGPFIANEKPYMCVLEGKRYFPLFSGLSESTLSSIHPAYSPVDWKKTKFESIWRAPVPYSHTTIDLASGNHLSPLGKQSLTARFRHWLGTDTLGRDVLAGMIRGCRVSLFVGIGSMLLALLMGVPLGAASAYWGNQKWRAPWIEMVITIVMIGVVIYIWIASSDLIFKIGGCIVAMLLMFVLILLSKKIKSKRIGIPLDAAVMSLISVIDSFPGLFIIIILLVILPVKGLLTVMIAIAILRWPVMARYIRAEIFKLKELNYIKAAQVLNLSDLRILMHHLIPYAFRPVMISFIFGITSAILAESSLSFLGIGLPEGEMNWGRLLAQTRNHFDDWWLMVFPGCAIFFTLLSFYTIGNIVQKKMESNQHEVLRLTPITAG